MTAEPPELAGRSAPALEQRVARPVQAIAELEQELARKSDEQAATAEILRIIAGAPTDLRSVLDAIVESAARLSGCSGSVLWWADGTVRRRLAAWGALASTTAPQEMPITRAAAGGRAIIDRESIQIPDLLVATDEYSDHAGDAERFGVRAVLATPLMRGADAIGSFYVVRVEPGRFPDGQVALLKTFADQAVIAIENTRLFEALQERNRDLAEALDQQTATGEVLKAISRSALDLRSVLDTLVENARRLCDASQGFIFRVDGGLLHLSADSGVSHVSPELRAFVQQNPRPIARDSAVGRAALERRVMHIPDVMGDLEFNPEFHRLGGVRTVLGVPMLREGILVGVFALWRREPRPFTDKQIALVTTFADQAVIAIENARLFGELEQRTVELGQALDQQTALSEILRVIATSPTDLPSVLNTIAERAASVLGAVDAIIDLRDGDSYVIAGGCGPLYKAVGERWPITNGSIAGRVLLTADTVHIEDIAAVAEREFPDRAAEYLRAGGGTRLAVPLLREGMAIGVIVVRRSTVRLCSDEEIARLRAFADQAVIAIENARLFDELAELNRTLEARVGEQVEQLERVGRLRRYLSPQLADMIVSSGDESILASHRRQITVLFCDLRGFTAFAETAEPEEVMGVLADYHAALGELIRRYGGTLDRFAGDGLMVFFNDPLPQPDHAERAVRMACAMRERAAELARGWRRQGHELGFGVGIAVGYATLGRIGFEGRFDYTAIGTVANLTARLCGEAPDGQILISARLHGMVENLVDAEPIGELALKGFHRPVLAFNITGLRDGESTEPAGTG